MDSIIQWIKNLIFIILFTSLLQMFLPENNMRKYVRIVMGFFIISILLSPLTVIFRQDFSSLQNIIPTKKINNNWGEIRERGDEIERSNQDLLLKYYEGKITDRVKEVIKLNYADYKQDIQVFLDGNYRLKALKIILTNNEINEIKIEPVEINHRQNQNITENAEERTNYRDIEIQNLKYKLSQFFQIPEDKIRITFITGGN